MPEVRGPGAEGSSGGSGGELVGRRAELAEISRRLGRHQLVTVSGVGGVGKTRLARRVAAELRPRFRDGVWWVELSPLTDGAMLAYAIAEALPLVDQSTRPMLDVLCEYLSGRELLLVLDTCEHVAEHCADVVAALLTVAPGLRVLATSRRPLGLPVEDLVPLAPLPEADAVALLARRAAEAVPAGHEGVPVGPDEAVALCRHLEGLPLAIELAAARLGEMTPAELTRRLADRFAVLGETREAVPGADPPWHQALRTAIGWSHQLCTPAERLAWARLSVFTGTFDVRAARRVLADERVPDADVPGLLAALVRGSIVEWQPTGSGERYRMLDTIREFGLCWLRGLGEEDAVRRRHRDHCLDLARAADSGWEGPDQVTWYGRTVAELANFRTALDFCLADDDGATARDLAATLWFVWFACGFPMEGRHYLDRALALPDAPGPGRARALWALGLLALAQGDTEASRRCAVAFRDTEAADAAADTSADATVPIATAYLAGAALATRGEHARAAEALEAAAPLPCPARGRYRSAWGLLRTAQAFSYVHLGRFDQAAAVADELTADCVRRGEFWLRAWGDYVHALAALSRGRAEEAADRAGAAIEGKRRFHDSLGIAMTTDVLASAAVACGDAERAARLLGTADRVWRSIGVPRLGSPELLAGREACEARARGLAGDAAFASAFHTGYASPGRAAPCPQSPDGLSPTRPPVHRQLPPHPPT
ncbi:NB-ARC domain-containing protein [Streptomyces sp. PmtG]